MTIYAVFDKQVTDGPRVVPDRFSWLAALLPPVFAVVHGLWLELIAYILLLMALFALSRTFGGEAGVLVYALLAIWIGFEAPAFRRAGLRRRGWNYRTEVIAPGADLAELEGIRSRPTP
ncbi:MAG TPA: DUF2628 domain-containing protein [Devosiaceae bacterium]|nr:DUF2628 domain-containing protein [Devosiaceae bacterium]